MEPSSDNTPYAQIGEEKLHQLIDRFYELVSQHPDISFLFPDDLAETARKQKQFLTQFLGGPALYTEEHGHPMLRARHMPFPITADRAKAWLSCMELAMNDVHLQEPIKSQLFHRLSYTAQHMINTKE
ncbi:hemoglobin [Evansella caseinilytica]|uniref:Hemoglobin n=1 Tax=Evansella caseinilytica TaxID=1503961 RepID=A0A1H3PIU8_9BACI|nr:globin [Evansella caseinilytica]SDZ00329.1 hemoglobin [Evansella caseinilytica]